MRNPRVARLTLVSHVPARPERTPLQGEPIEDARAPEEQAGQEWEQEEVQLRHELVDNDGYGVVFVFVGRFFSCPWARGGRELSILSSSMDSLVSVAPFVLRRAVARGVWSASLRRP